LAIARQAAKMLKQDHELSRRAEDVVRQEMKVAALHRPKENETMADETE